MLATPARVFNPFLRNLLSYNRLRNYRLPLSPPPGLKATGVSLRASGTTLRRAAVVSEKLEGTVGDSVFDAIVP